MASPFYRTPPTPPGIYRAARALRRLSTLALVLIIVFVAVVAYSAVQVVKTRPHLGSSAVALEANDTVGVSSSFSLTNPTYFSIEQFALHFLILNASGVQLLDTTTPPSTIAAGAATTVPIDLFLPLTAAGESLLTEDQYLDWNVWGNASYAYLFTVSILVQTERSWGAPFDNLTVVVGPPEMVGGMEEVPVTLSFADDASFADVGNLDYQVVSPGGAVCSSGAFALDVDSNTAYDETQEAVLTSGCNPVGGHVSGEFVGDGVTVPFPSEPIG